MNFTKNGYPHCTNCKFAQTQYCLKFKQECISFQENGNSYQIPCNQCLDNDNFETLEQNNNYSNINLNNNNIAYFHIPSLSNLKKVKFLLSLKEKYPDIFIPNREIIEIYDSFVGAMWNGRSPLFNKQFLSIQEINQIKNQLEALKINLNLTWNNHLIEEQDLQDKYCNLITELFHNGKHAITVSSDILFTYLKEKYPNFIYYQSIIQVEGQSKFPKKDGYDMFLSPSKNNNNWDELLKIPEDERNTIEFLCNDSCFPGCPKQHHYEAINYCLKNYAYQSCLFDIDCPIDWRFSFYNSKRWPTTIKPNDIDTYVKYGFHHFKLSSRGDNPLIIYYKICKYLIKPEFFEDIYFQGIGADILNGN